MPRDGRLLVYLEVTETLRHPRRAGIQRVVVELLAGLWRHDLGVDVVPVTWSELDAAYRQATTTEVASLLAAKPAGDPPLPAAEPTGLQQRAANAVRRTPAGPALDRWRRSVARSHPRDGARDLLLDGWARGAVFLDADATWNAANAPRAALHRELHRDGVSVVVFQHDVLPLDRPEWFHPTLPERFADHLRATVEHADLVICNSASTREGVVRLAAERRLGGTVRTAVVPLAGGPNCAPSDVRAVTTSAPTLLVVGTLEPRKNHALALDVLEQLSVDHPDVRLLVVGRRGWHDDALVARIEDMAAAGRGVVWRSDVDDDELDAMYHSATCVLVPSLDEGFGLPVVEALARGAVVLASDVGALREVGGDAVIRLPPHDVEAWVEAAARHLDDIDHHREAKERAARTAARTWTDVSADVAAALGDLTSASAEGRDVEEEVVEDPRPHP